MSLLSAVCSAHWAMTEASLGIVLDIVERKNPPPEAVAAQLGRPLDNTHEVEVRDGIAVIPVVGPLCRYANLFSEVSGATSYQVLARDFTAALADPSVKGILLEINSPGGEVNGCAELAEMIYDARGQKPIVAYIDGDGCSAAYWIATAADRVAAAQTAITGSIGVRSTLVDTSKRDEAEGVQERIIVSSNAPRKALEGINKASIAALQETLNALEGVFVDKVARNRGVSRAKVLADFGRGGVLVAGAASEGVPSGIEAGLVDEISTFEAVLAQMASAGPALPGSRPLGQIRSRKTALSQPASALAGASQPRDAEDTMDPEMKALHDKIDALGAKVDKNHDDHKASYEKTHEKIDALASKQDENHAEIMKCMEQGDDPMQGSRAAVEPGASVEGVGEILAITGTASLSEAKGKILAALSASAQLEGLQAQVAAKDAELQTKEVEALVDGAIKEGKVTPAQRDSMLAIGRKDVAMLKGFLQNAPKLSAVRGHEQQPLDEPTEALSEEIAAMTRRFGNDPAKVAKAIQGVRLAQ